MGNLLATIANDGKTDIVTQYQYDTANRITKMITGLSAYSANPTGGAVTQYSYNNRGYLAQTTDPMGLTETYNSYDYAGNVLSMTDKNGNTMYNEYGTYGLVKSYFDNLPETKEYTYNKLGQLVAEKSVNANEQSVEESYEYDAFGRLVKSAANDGSVQTYAYDGNSNVTSYELTKDDVVKNSVEYLYDNLNQLTRLINNDIITSYGYDANGNLIRKSLNNGVVTNYTYNKAGLMTYMKTQRGGNAYTDYDCRYLLNGLLSAVYMPYEGDPTANENKIKHYTYDNAGRLTADGIVNGAGQPHANTYQYDLRGNRVSQTSGIPDDLISTQTDYEYDLNNQLLNESSHTQDEYHNTHSYSSTRYYYDDNGNMTAKQVTNKGDFPATRSSRMALSGHSSNTGLEIYRYDAFNRLTNYNSGSDEASYTYSANNLRASKTVNRERMDFVWNGQNLAAESKGEKLNTYAYDITGVHVANQNGTVTSYLKDYHGNVIGKTTKTGVMFNEMGTTTDYDAFGNRWQGDAPDPFGYCGEYLDNESGLIYLRNRYYDSTSGRFITEDPVKDGLNWYSYCVGNPVGFIDPSGLYVHITTDQGVILDNLRILTRDDIAINGDGYVYIKKFNSDESDRTYGTSLIRELIENPNTCEIRLRDIYTDNQKNATIQDDLEAASKHGVGSDVTVYFESNYKNQDVVWVSNENGDIVQELVPVYIALSHELIHSLRSMKGSRKPSHLKGTNWMLDGNEEKVRQEELDTVGLNHYRDDGTYADAYNWGYTENTIRSELGHCLRVRYY